MVCVNFVLWITIIAACAMIYQYKLIIFNRNAKICFAGDVLKILGNTMFWTFNAFKVILLFTSVGTVWVFIPGHNLLCLGEDDSFLNLHVFSGLLKWYSLGFGHNATRQIKSFSLTHFYKWIWCIENSIPYCTNFHALINIL